MSEVLIRIESKVQNAYKELDNQQAEAIKFFDRRKKNAAKITTEDTHYIREVRLTTTSSGKIYSSTI